VQRFLDPEYKIKSDYFQYRHSSIDVVFPPEKPEEKHQKHQAVQQLVRSSRLSASCCWEGTEKTDASNARY